MSKNNYYNGRFFTEYAFTLNDKHDFKFLAGLDMESNITLILVHHVQT